MNTTVTQIKDIMEFMNYQLYNESLVNIMQIH